MGLSVSKYTCITSYLRIYKTPVSVLAIQRCSQHDSPEEIGTYVPGT